MNTIFIQIASYRDPQLIPTILDAINKAKFPENLVFGICRQYHPNDEFDSLKDFRDDNRFRILDVLYNESKGVCWARNKIQGLYKKEKYTLQLDSHHRFIQDWDHILVEMFEDLKHRGHKKPLITAYAPSYNTSESSFSSQFHNFGDTFTYEISSLFFDRFVAQGPLFPKSKTITDLEILKNPIPTRLLSAHFIFTLGKFCKEVRYNPEIYFHGEESSMAVRAWTHGYDMFNPNKNIIWHEYNPKGLINRVRHWDDVDISPMERVSYYSYKRLFGMDGIEQTGKEEYGFGNTRSLKDYEIWAGIRFSDRSISRCALGYNLPNDCIYETYEKLEQDLVKFYKHAIIFPYSMLSRHSYDYWIVDYFGESGKILFRKRVDKKEIKELKSENDGYYKIWSEFEYEELPKKYMVTGKLLSNKASENLWGPL